MKVVINRCYGGFSLSARAVARIAELQGRPCYFFKTEYAPKRVTRRISLEEAQAGDLFVSAFDVPELPEKIEWAKMTPKQREESNEHYTKHYLTNSPDDRSDPLLVRVVEELGRDADGAYAELEVVEIPDGTDYTIEEYDGMEHVAEVHRTWR